MTDTRIDDLVDTIVALSALWNRVQEPGHRAIPLVVARVGDSVNDRSVRPLVGSELAEDLETGYEEVLVSHLEMLRLTELGYLGPPQIRGDQELLFLTPDGIELAAGTEEETKERVQRLVDKITQQQRG